VIDYLDESLDVAELVGGPLPELDLGVLGFGPQGTCFNAPHRFEIGVRVAGTDFGDWVTTSLSETLGILGRSFEGHSSQLPSEQADP
jgi:hypothetical protein